MTSFPLTPALSPSEGERENRSPVLEKSSDCNFTASVGATNELLMLFPLPIRWGEGQGGHCIRTWVTEQRQHIGNAWLGSKACRNAGRELLSSSSQAPKSKKYGGCDELDNSSQGSPGCVLLPLLSEKVLPMSCAQSVTHVLIQCQARLPGNWRFPTASLDTWHRTPAT